MPTEKFSAYTDRGDVLTTQLNALANGSYSAAGAAYNNSSNRDRHAVAELVVTFGSNATNLSTCSLYLVSSPDGTNYEDGGGATAPSPSNFLAQWTLRAATAFRLVTPRFEIPPTLVKFVLLNSSGVAFPASGSTVGLYTFNRDITA